jgi:hypothetical protein
VIKLSSQAGSMEFWALRMLMTLGQTSIALSKTKTDMQMRKNPELKSLDTSVSHLKSL